MLTPDCSARSNTTDTVHLLQKPSRPKMSCETGSSCGDCTSSCSPGNRVIDIEDLNKELESLRKRSKELEEKLSSLKTEDDPLQGIAKQTSKLRSANWFNNKDSMPMTALYTDRYLNYGLTREELMSNKPIIGIANSGSDIAPCNRYHLELAHRVREGIRSAGAIAMEFPTHPIQESSRRPTATLDRNLSYLTLVEMLHAYPFDGVVLMTGCDKTTPACLMAAATMVWRIQMLAFPWWFTNIMTEHSCNMPERGTNAQRIHGQESHW